jgi:5-methylcytosine-specific restriction endonuclease McrA
MFSRDYNDPEYKKARAAARKRDGYKCQYPGCAIKKGLQVHHIYRWVDQPHLRHNIDNLISLCKMHHHLIKNNEDSYISIFLSVIAQNKIKKQHGKKK